MPRAVLLLGLLFTVHWAACSSKSVSTVSCTDGVQNGDETDVDCGGSCGPCRVGQGCQIGGRDCTTSTCMNGRCVAPSCSDGQRNGSESDVDCGGNCPPCAVDAGCAIASDCQSGFCPEGRCAISCDDAGCAGSMNGNGDGGVDGGGG